MKRIKVIGFTFVLLCMSLPVWARCSESLNEITFRLNKEAWVTSKTAEVTVAIHANLNQSQLEAVHQSIESKLNQIANGANWHIMQFVRTKDQSGLESVSSKAQARLPLSQLGQIRAMAKKVSQPGETFTIDGIDYSPSTREVEKVRSQLRDEMYKEVKAELARLNALYNGKGQRYFLHQINFNMALAPVSQPRLMDAANRHQARSELSVAGNINVSQRIAETATAVLASRLPSSTS